MYIYVRVYVSGEDPPGVGHGSPLQYSCLENPHGQRSLVSPWGLYVHTHTHTHGEKDIYSHTLERLEVWFQYLQHCDKTNTTIESHKLFSFPVHIKVILTLDLVY